MKRNLSGLGVTTSGLLLAAAGGYGMWSGWDLIQLERGWSLFISGAVALSGGVVTIALGRVVAHLARLAPQVASDTPAVIAAPPVSTAAPPAPPPKPAVAAKPVEAPAEKPLEEPTEVDRYTAGEATYVMYSDGSVEMRTATGSERFSSLAELRAVADARKQ
ncbi:hypothetical protein LG047_02115 [Methylocystis sp. WRRC1]|uniref:hypothetical protein n=1 Tax=unclassified Methylocystis TaxID=2625913 RepID=UPI0001F867BE|nr:MULTISPECIES: hypothetical protein [unclassified Methylocystis]MCC3244126.1 hypothetical protein [Methylocystis sp. WRRC1]